MPQPRPWDTLTIEQTRAALGAGDEGLIAKEPTARLARDGANELPRADCVSVWRILAERFRNVLIIILLIAVALSAFLGETLEAVVIAVIVLFAIVLGFVQELRAERALEAPRRMAAPASTVNRGGRELSVPPRELVVGDLIPVARYADLRLLTGQERLGPRRDAFRALILLPFIDAQVRH